MAFLPKEKKNWLKNIKVLNPLFLCYIFDYARLAQLVEHSAYTGLVGGSNPSSRTRQKIPTAWDFLALVRDGGMFFQQKKQPSSGRENLQVTTSKLFLTTKPTF
jgi:hypothetical protein